MGCSKFRLCSCCKLEWRRERDGNKWLINENTNKHIQSSKKSPGKSQSLRFPRPVSFSQFRFHITKHQNLLHLPYFNYWLQHIPTTGIKNHIMGGRQECTLVKSCTLIVEPNLKRFLKVRNPLVFPVMRYLSMMTMALMHSASSNRPLIVYRWMQGGTEASNYK